MNKKKRHQQMMDSLYSTLHECKNCEECNYYSIVPCRNFGPNAYCYYPENKHTVMMHSTEKGIEPQEIEITKEAPDEHNLNNNCEWKIIG